MTDQQPVPECATCRHQHSAAFTNGRLTATGPCHCDCTVETRTGFLFEQDRGQVWLDERGRIWEWDDVNGWVVDGMATFGGFDPPDDAVFTRAFSGVVECLDGPPGEPVDRMTGPVGWIITS